MMNGDEEPGLGPGTGTAMMNWDEEPGPGLAAGTMRRARLRASICHNRSTLKIR